MLCEINRESSAVSPFVSDSRFTQQELPACKPILTPQWVSASLPPPLEPRPPETTDPDLVENKLARPSLP